MSSTKGREQDRKTRRNAHGGNHGMNHLQHDDRKTTEHSKNSPLQAKSAMWESALTDLLNASTETSILLDTNGTIVALNDTAARRIGKSIEELIGKQFSTVLPSSVAATRTERIARVVASGKPIRFEEICDGRIIDNNLSPVFDAEGRIKRLSLFGVDITQRRQSERLLKERQAELKKRSRELEELNAALKVLLREREKDKELIENRMLMNMKDLVMPYLEQLKSSHLTADQKIYVKILERNLSDVVSPFARKLSSPFIHLTPKEIQVASLVKDGRTNKEIADICHVSVKTVEFYRSNIRNKLGLKHTKTNLYEHLCSLAWKDGLR